MSKPFIVSQHEETGDISMADKAGIFNINMSQMVRSLRDGLKKKKPSTDLATSPAPDLKVVQG